MANTTNFGWETPDDTDLVKDGAAAMRTLGNAIDNSLVDLKGGTSGQVLAKNSNADMDFVWTNGGDITEVAAGVGISGGGTSGNVTITNSMATAIDAKGDLVAGTGADTFARLQVGANDTVLIADSATATGLKWGSPNVDSMVLLASGSLTSNTVTLSSISGIYKDLYFRIYNPSLTGTAGKIGFRVNGVTAANYQAVWTRSNTNTLTNITGATNFETVENVELAAGKSFIELYIPEYADGDTVKFLQQRYTKDFNGLAVFGVACCLNASAYTAINSVTVFSQNASNFDAGTYELFGVK